MISTHQQRGHKSQLRQREIFPYARVPALRKRRERPLVPHHLRPTVPPLRHELVRPLKAAFQPADRVARGDDGGTAGDVAARDGDALGGRFAVAARGDRGVDAKGFVDEAVEVREGLEGFGVGDVDVGEFGVKFGDVGGVEGEFVEEEYHCGGYGVARRGGGKG